MKANIWKITGYKGYNDYDGPLDNNIEIEIVMDTYFSKNDVEDIMVNYYSKFYRIVVIKAYLLKECTINSD